MHICPHMFIPVSICVCVCVCVCVSVCLSVCLSQFGVLSIYKMYVDVNNFSIKKALKTDMHAFILFI